MPAPTTCAGSAPTTSWRVGPAPTRSRADPASTGPRTPTLSSGVVANLANAGLNTGEAAGDVYLAIRGLQGSNHADVLVANTTVPATRSRAGRQRCAPGEDGDDNLDGGDGGD